MKIHWHYGKAGHSQEKRSHCGSCIKLLRLYLEGKNNHCEIAEQIILLFTVLDKTQQSLSEMSLSFCLNILSLYRPNLFHFYFGRIVLYKCLTSADSTTDVRNTVAG